MGSRVPVVPELEHPVDGAGSEDLVVVTVPNHGSDGGGVGGVTEQGARGTT